MASSPQELHQRAVLFADLRGSTALYEHLGNAEASVWVTQTVSAMAHAVPASDGRVIKTLGDGLMALFADPAKALQAAADLHTGVEQSPIPRSLAPSRHPRRPLSLQVSIAFGEVAEVGDDIFGDAVNVAARLLDHAGDGETLITDAVLHAVAPRLAARFRNLDWVHLRGRTEPVLVHVLGGKRHDQGAVTQFEAVKPSPEPGALRLSWAHQTRLLGSHQLPALLGRSPQSAVPIEDPRVSRLHARLDWHGASFHLTDLSANGTVVRFDGSQSLHLRRTQCTLQGTGAIGLSGEPDTPGIPTLRFEVLAGIPGQPHAGPDTES